jgi:hypothetical protein
MRGRKHETCTCCRKRRAASVVKPGAAGNRVSRQIAALAIAGITMSAGTDWWARRAAALPLLPCVYFCLLNRICTRSS